ncbi:MAG: response regulator [Spirochaetia bacterium]|nr:response regulator [Spirochaetia bacterium]
MNSDDNKVKIGEKKRLKVLIIEDNPSDAQLIAENLRIEEPDGVDITISTNLKSGIEAASAGNDIVLLDLWLPDSTGISTLKEFKAQNNIMPVIVITGLENGELAIEAIHSGAQNYIVKESLDGKSLARSIRYAIERMTIETKLKQSRDELSDIFESSPVIMFVVDPAMKIRKTNKTAADFMGIESVKAVGMLIGNAMGCWNCEGYELKCGDTPECYRCPVRLVALDTLKTGEIYQRIEIGKELVINKKKGTYHFYYSAAPIEFEGTHMILLNLVDISYRIEAESKMQKAMESMREAEMIKSNFLAMVSHELRTPLTSVNGFLSFLMAGAAGPMTERQAEFLAAIKNNSDRLLNLINDILDVSKMESGTFSIEKHSVYLEKILNRACADIAGMAVKRGIKIDKKIMSKNIIADADEQRMVQVVTNLLGNCIKFSYDNSTVEVILELKKDGDFVPPSGFERTGNSAGWAMITVIDNGMGIEKDECIRIFDRFYQVRGINQRESKGVGLGLNISKNIIAAHGGMIWAESDGLNKGSSFRAVIPLGSGMKSAEQTPGTAELSTREDVQ